MDLVSVIIPYYKKKKFILETVESALNQSYPNLEILLIYDDDNENDLNFIRELQKRDNRIIVIKNKTRMGAGISRNIGINKSKGKYVAFLDADDTWHPNKLNKQIKFMKNFNYFATHTSYSIINESKLVIGKRIARSFLKLDELLKSCDIGTSTVIIRKNIFDTNIKFASLKTKEDFVLWLRLLKKNIKIYALNEDLTKWKKSKNSLSSSTFQKLIDGFKVYYIYMNFGCLKSIYYLICLCVNFIKK